MITLEQGILDSQKRGWILVSQVGNTAQMRKPKTFGFMRFLICVLFCWTIVVPLFLILDYAVRKEPLILLTYIDGDVKTKTLAY